MPHQRRNDYEEALNRHYQNTANVINNNQRMRSEGEGVNVNLPDLNVSTLSAEVQREGAQVICQGEHMYFQLESPNWREGSDNTNLPKVHFSRGINKIPQALLPPLFAETGRPPVFSSKGNLSQFLRQHATDHPLISAFRNGGSNSEGSWRNSKKEIQREDYRVEFPDEEDSGEEVDQPKLDSREENTLALSMGTGLCLKRKLGEEGVNEEVTQGILSTEK